MSFTNIVQSPNASDLNIDTDGTVSINGGNVFSSTAEGADAVLVTVEFNIELEAGSQLTSLPNTVLTAEFMLSDCSYAAKFIDTEGSIQVKYTIG